MILTTDDWFITAGDVFRVSGFEYRPAARSMAGAIVSSALTAECRQPCLVYGYAAVPDIKLRFKRFESFERAHCAS